MSFYISCHLAFHVILVILVIIVIIVTKVIMALMLKVVIEDRCVLKKWLYIYIYHRSSSRKELFGAKNLIKNALATLITFSMIKHFCRNCDDGASTREVKYVTVFQKHWKLTKELKAHIGTLVHILPLNTFQ